MKSRNKHKVVHRPSLLVSHFAHAHASRESIETLNNNNDNTYTCKIPIDSDLFRIQLRCVSSKENGIVLRLLKIMILAITFMTKMKKR